MIRSVYYKVYKNILKNLKTKRASYKPLLTGLLKNRSGRNNSGQIVNYHRGGGVKRLYRNVCHSYVKLLTYNLKRWVVERIEYDPNRTTNIALLRSNYWFFSRLLKKPKNPFFHYFFNTIYIYRIASENLKKGDFISFFDKTSQEDLFDNQYTPLKYVDTGSEIFNLELIPFTKGIFVRSAGCKAKFLRKYEKYGLVVLPSKKRKLIRLNCYVSLGRSSNSLLKFKKDYKAGNSRLKNVRPRVRGVAMNPVDHPHGGGEGKTSGGRHTVSKWGKLTKGFVTKKKKIKKKIKYV